MLLALIVWLVMTVLPTLKVVAIIATIATVGITVVLGLYSIDFGTDKLKVWLKKLWWIVPAVVLLNLTPNEKTSWYMVGAYATQTVVQSETAKQFAGDGVDVLHSLMKKAKEKIDNYDAEDAPKEAKAK